jgi:hypothetical protein
LVNLTPSIDDYKIAPTDGTHWSYALGAHTPAHAVHLARTPGVVDGEVCFLYASLHISYSHDKVQHITQKLVFITHYNMSHKIVHYNYKSKAVL